MGRQRRLRHRAGYAGVAVACAVLAACTTVDGRGSVATTPPTPSPTTTTSPSPSPSPSSSSPRPNACPKSYVQPDPNRPRVRLDFTVSADLTTVRGTEHVEFTPDRPVDELVFRLTANTAPTVAAGNQIVVTTATAGPDGGRFHFTQAGADPSTQGGLLRIPLRQTASAGSTVTADISFSVTLGAESFDRFGRTGSGASRYAWFASAHPLLAWEHGFGWHTEELLKFTAESATSEAMDTELSVTAPGAMTVIMTGNPADPPPSSGTRTWRATLAAARDVSVAVGPFTVRDTTVGSTRLRVGGYDAQSRDQLTSEFQRGIIELERFFGPYPYPSLAVARVPAEGGGIEYPAAILMLDSSRVTAVHEAAHMWFYGMVGDSQSLHPWLDEAFATYAEQLVDGGADLSALGAPGTVGRSTQSYGYDEFSYYFVTYAKGGAALHAAREAAGAPAWDAAVRCYVNANAWRIADPRDFADAIKKFPESVAILRQAGALP